MTLIESEGWRHKQSFYKEHIVGVGCYEPYVSIQVIVTCNWNCSLMKKIRSFAFIVISQFYKLFHKESSLTARIPSGYNHEFPLLSRRMDGGPVPLPIPDPGTAWNPYRSEWSSMWSHEPECLKIPHAGFWVVRSWWSLANQVWYSYSIPYVAESCVDHSEVVYVSLCFFSLMYLVYNYLLYNLMVYIVLEGHRVGEGWKLNIAYQKCGFYLNPFIVSMVMKE